MSKRPMFRGADVDEYDYPYTFGSSLVARRYGAEVSERIRQANSMQGWVDALAIGQTPERPWDAKSARAAHRLAKKSRLVAHRKINGDVEYKIGGRHVETRDKRGRIKRTVDGSLDSMLVGREPSALATALGIPLVQALDVTARPPVIKPQQKSEGDPPPKSEGNPPPKSEGNPPPKSEGSPLPKQQGSQEKTVRSAAVFSFNNDTDDLWKGLREDPRYEETGRQDVSFINSRLGELWQKKQAKSDKETGAAIRGGQTLRRTGKAFNRAKKGAGRWRD